MLKKELGGREFITGRKHDKVAVTQEKDKTLKKGTERTKERGPREC